MEPIIYAHFEEATNAAKNLAIQSRETVTVKRHSYGWSVIEDQLPLPAKPKVITPSITHPGLDRSRTPSYRPPATDTSGTYDEYEDSPQSNYIDDDDDDEEIDAKDVADREQDYWDEVGDDRDNSARSSDEGWYYPEGEGSVIDNCNGE